MIALRLLLVVALAFTVYAGEDLKLAYKLSKCLKKAVTEGVPSLNYPDHNPLEFKNNVSWTGDVGIARATLNLSNIVWYGIPSWKVSIAQLSNDNDSVAVLPYSLSWDRFVVTSKYTIETDVVMIPGKISGDLNVTFDHNIWGGSVNFTKPGFNLTDGVQYLDMEWTFEAVDFNFTGLGFLNEPISSSFATIAKAYFDSGAMGNLLGERFQNKLNSSWFAHPEKIDKLFEFCRGNSTVS